MYPCILVNPLELPGRRALLLPARGPVRASRELPAAGASAAYAGAQNRRVTQVTDAVCGVADASEHRCDAAGFHMDGIPRAELRRRGFSPAFRQGLSAVCLSFIPELRHSSEEWKDAPWLAQRSGSQVPSRPSPGLVESCEAPLRSCKSICWGPISPLPNLLLAAYSISCCLVGAAESFSTARVNSKYWDLKPGVMGVLMFLAERRLHFLCSLQARSSSAVLNNAPVPRISGTG